MARYAFGHVHLRTENLQHAIAFYEKNFGAKLEWRRPGGGGEHVRLNVKGAGIMISTQAENENPLPGSTHPKFGLDHFGFEVDDMDGAVRTLKANGVEFTCEPWEIRPGIRIAFVKAPDNVSIELSWYAQKAAV